MEPITPWTTDLAYLQDEFAWVAARCTRVALERRRDTSPEERSVRRGGYFADDERIEPKELAARIAAGAASERRLREQIDARLVAHRAGDTFELGLDKLVRAHGLDDFDRVVLLLASGPCVSRRFERLYAGLDGDRQATLTVETVFTFLALDASERVARRASLGPRGRLLTSDLIEMNYGIRPPPPKALLETEIELRGRTFSLILGDGGLGDELADLARIEAPLASFEHVVLPDDDRRRILSAIDGHDHYMAMCAEWGLADRIRYGRAITMLFDGAPGTGKTLTAHAVAHRLGKRILSVDAPTLLAHEDAGEFLPGLCREAQRAGAVLFVDEAETLLFARSHGNPLAHVLLREVERSDAVIIFATNLAHLLDDAVDRRILVRVGFTLPDAPRRRAIWKALLPPRLPLAGDVDVDRLADAHAISGGAIKNAILVGASHAIHEAPEGSPIALTHAMLDTAAREQGEGRRLTQADRDRFEREQLAGARPRNRPAGFM